MRTIAYLFFIALLTSCAPKIVNTKTTTVRDSLVIKEVHHMDTVRIKGDTITIEKFVGEQAMPFTEEKKQGRADVKITISHGQLSVKCKCDSIQKALDIVLKDTSRYKFTATNEIRTVQVKFIPRFYKFTFWSFWLLVAIVAGGVVYRFRKLLPAPFNLIP